MYVHTYMSILTYRKVEEKQQTHTSKYLQQVNEGKSEIFNAIAIDASPP